MMDTRTMQNAASPAQGPAEGIDVGGVVFDPRALDDALADFSAAAMLPQATQRLVAARVMLSMSLASAVADAAQYEASIERLGPLPVAVGQNVSQGEIEAFYFDLGAAMAMELIEELGDCDATAIFVERLRALFDIPQVLPAGAGRIGVA